MSNNTYVYDKAKYHQESVENLGLAEEHTYNHTTFFLAWLIKNHLMSEWFEEEGAADLARYRKGAMSINQLYETWDCCLVSDMLSDDGNSFAMSYFDFEKGAYIRDYAEHLQGDLPSEFHVSYTPENEATIHRLISARYQEWQGSP